MNLQFRLHDQVDADGEEYSCIVPAFLHFMPKRKSSLGLSNAGLDENMGNSEKECSDPGSQVGWAEGLT